jgi:iron complex transport system substrate-binding protein
MKASRLPTLAFAMLLSALILSSCGGSEEPAQAPAATQSMPPATSAAPGTPVRTVLANIPGIVDPGNLGWPRTVEGLNGRVTIKTKPERIVTVSLGHDEVTYGLVPPSRVIAVGAFTKQPDSSNVADLAANLPTLAREPEAVIATRPDIIVASFTSRADFIEALTRVGLTVVQLRLNNDPQGRINDILLMGYVYGEEERGVALAREVQARYDALQKTVAQKSPRPRVLATSRFTDKLYVGGKGSTAGAIVEAAGGLNAAAEAGLSGNPTIDAEGIIAMRPEVIVISQPADSAEEYRQWLLANAALREVPAIKNRRVHVVAAKWMTTLSFWNLRGAEEMAKLLYPSDFAGKEFPPFSRPQ